MRRFIYQQWKRIQINGFIKSI